MEHNKGVSSLQMETDILVLPLGKGKTKPQGFPHGKQVKINTQKFASYQGNKPKPKSGILARTQPVLYLSKKMQYFPDGNIQANYFFFFSLGLPAIIFRIKLVPLNHSL